nr:hypothetical protein [Tanacetum cinerariifolium]
VANLSTYPSKRFNSFYYDDDDDEDYTVVITPDFPITDSLIMENEYLDTIPKTESDEFIKSSVENFVQIPSPHETCQCDQLIFDEPYCKHCGGPHMNFQCQPMNQDSYNSNSLGFDQPQPSQSPIIHQPPQELSIQEMEDLKQQYLDELKRLKNFNCMSIEIRKKEKLLQLEQWANLSTHPSKRLNSFSYDDDDDDEDYNIAVTPSLSIEEPDNSLSMGDEHLDTISATKSDEVIKSSVENLIPIPSESEGIPEHMCDVPFHDNYPPLDVSKDQFEDFFESNDEFSSIDDDSFSIDNIDYVAASPSDSELVNSEVMEIVIPEVGGLIMTFF